MYIFGSIHQPYNTLWPKIPRNVKKAFKSSKKLYVEIDVKNPATVLTISNCMYLTNQTLADVLPMRVYEKLRKYLQYFKSQIPKWLNEISKTKGKVKVENPNDVFEEMTKYWYLKRPIWILLMLNSFNKETVETRAIQQLDGYMYSKARQANKTIGYLESAEERCRLSYLNSSQVCIMSRRQLVKADVAVHTLHIIKNPLY